MNEALPSDSPEPGREGRSGEMRGSVGHPPVTLSAVTLADVAARAGVSAMTVSNVINGKANVRPQTRERVLAAIEATGYRVNPLARALAGGKGRMLSVYSRRLNKPYAMEVVQGAAQAADELGYDLVVMMLGEGSTSPDLSVMSRLSVGALLIQPNGSDWLNSPDLPAHTVSVDGAGDRPFTVDNSGGAWQAVRHLIALGHTRIAFISGLGGAPGQLPDQSAPDRPSPDQAELYEHSDGAERLRGYRTCMAAAGLEVPPEYEQPGDYSKASGERAAARLLALDPPPTALFVSGDAMALGAIHAAQDRGLKVPGDLSVVGFDDLPLAAASRPALTTVRQPLQEMGELAVQMLVALAEGLPQALPPPFETRLVVRESTAPPPG